MNSYRHCDGFATSKDDIIGWPRLKADFEAADFPTPVLFGEYGCREFGFPTIDGFETQRTWFQAEALYTPEYSDVFAGGFVFEYSSEKEVVDTNLQFMADRFNNGVPTSEWPYIKFAKLNYGIGYFTPENCQHDDGSDDNTFTPCEYEKYPEWEGLAQTLAQADALNVNAQAPGSIPACPQQFPPLSLFEWPTDEEEDPDLEYCLELKRMEDAKTNPPTAGPTQDPTMKPTEDDSSTAETDAPTIPPSESVTQPKLTLWPTTAPSSKPSFVPTILTVQDITTMSPTLPPAMLPTTPIPAILPTLPPTTQITSLPTSSPTFMPMVLPNAMPTPLPTASPSVKPSSKPTTLPTTLPTGTPTNPPTLRPSPSSTLQNTLSATMSPSTAPTASSTSSPTMNVTEINTAQCSFHPKCYAANLAGLCCPTLDGVLLGCCSEFWETEENAAESSSESIRYSNFIAISSFLMALFMS